MIRSFIRMAHQMKNNWIPTFPEVTGDSRRMNYNHGVATVIDSYKKAFRISIWQKHTKCANLFQGMKQVGTRNHQFFNTLDRRRNYGTLERR